MSAGPGPLQRLSKLLYIFFLRALYWFSSIKPQKELDDEARIGLPANFVYRKRLRTWIIKHFRRADSSQSLQHLGEPGLLSMQLSQCRAQVNRGMGSEKGRVSPFSYFEEEKPKKGSACSFF